MKLEVGTKVVYQLPDPQPGRPGAYRTGQAEITAVRKNAQGVVDAVAFGKLFGFGWVPVRCVTALA